VSAQNIRNKSSLDEGFLASFERLDEARPKVVRSVHLLLSQPRTGSTLVCDYLSKSADLGWCDEWLNPYQMRVIGEQLVLRQRLKAPAFNDVLNWTLQRAVSSEGNVVINLQVPHIVHWQRRGVKLHNLGRNVVYLRRRSLVEQALSHAKARHTKQWYQVEGQIPQLASVSDSEISKSLMNILAWGEVAENFLQNRRFVEIFYEDVLADRSAIDAVFKAYGSHAKTEDLPLSNLARQQTAADRNAIKRFLAHISAGQESPNT